MPCLSLPGTATDAPRSTGQSRTMSRALCEGLRAQRKEQQVKGGSYPIRISGIWHTYLHSLDSEVYGNEQSLCWLAI